MISYFWDGDNDVISRRKVLTSGECTRSVRPAPAAAHAVFRTCWQTLLQQAPDGRCVCTHQMSTLFCNSVYSSWSIPQRIRTCLSYFHIGAPCKNYFLLAAKSGFDARLEQVSTQSGRPNQISAGLCLPVRSPRAFQFSTPSEGVNIPQLSYNTHAFSPRELLGEGLSGENLFALNLAFTVLSWSMTRHDTRGLPSSDLYPELDTPPPAIKC